MKIKKFFIIPILLLMVTGVYVLINLLPKNVEAASDSSSTSDLQLMARAINGEARGEPYEGQVAVGAVILNRVKSSQFPNTIAGVIYEKGAFTAVSDGQINVPIKEGSTVLKAARDAMDGTQRVEQYIILIQAQLQTSGFGQDHLLRQLENIDFVNKEEI